MNDPTALRDAIRAYIKAHPTPQRQLASELGVSHSWLTKFALGRINSPRVDRLSRLSKWVESDRISRAG